MAVGPRRKRSVLMKRALHEGIQTRGVVDHSAVLELSAKRQTSENPLCRECGGPIPIGTRHTVYCSRPCAGRFTKREAKQDQRQLEDAKRLERVRSAVKRWRGGPDDWKGWLARKARVTRNWLSYHVIRLSGPPAIPPGVTLGRLPDAVFRDAFTWLLIDSGDEHVAAIGNGFYFCSRPLKRGKRKAAAR